MRSHDLRPRSSLEPPESRRRRPTSRATTSSSQLLSRRAAGPAVDVARYLETADAKYKPPPQSFVPDLTAAFSAEPNGGTPHRSNRYRQISPAKKRRNNDDDDDDEREYGSGGGWRGEPHRYRMPRDDEEGPAYWCDEYDEYAAARGKRPYAERRVDSRGGTTSRVNYKTAGGSGRRRAPPDRSTHGTSPYDDEYEAYEDAGRRGAGRSPVRRPQQYVYSDEEEEDEEEVMDNRDDNRLRAGRYRTAARDYEHTPRRHHYQRETNASVTERVSSARRRPRPYAEEAVGTGDEGEPPQPPQQPRFISTTERVRYRNEVTRKVLDFVREVSDIYDCRATMESEIVSAMCIDPRWSKETKGVVTVASQPSKDQRIALNATLASLDILQSACVELVATYLTPEEKRYLGLNTHFFQSRRERETTYQYMPNSSSGRAGKKNVNSGRGMEEGREAKPPAATTTRKTTRSTRRRTSSGTSTHSEEEASEEAPEQERVGRGSQMGTRRDSVTTPVAPAKKHTRLTSSAASRTTRNTPNITNSNNTNSHLHRDPIGGGREEDHHRSTTSETRRRGPVSERSRVSTPRRTGRGEEEKHKKNKKEREDGDGDGEGEEVAADSGIPPIPASFAPPPLPPTYQVPPAMAAALSSPPPPPATATTTTTTTTLAEEVSVPSSGKVSQRTDPNKSARNINKEEKDDTDSAGDGDGDGSGQHTPEKLFFDSPPPPPPAGATTQTATAVRSPSASVSSSVEGSELTGGAGANTATIAGGGGGGGSVTGGGIAGGGGDGSSSNRRPGASSASVGAVAGGGKPVFPGSPNASSSVLLPSSSLRRLSSGGGAPPAVLPVKRMMPVGSASSSPPSPPAGVVVKKILAGPPPPAMMAIAKFRPAVPSGRSTPVGSPMSMLTTTPQPQPQPAPGQPPSFPSPPSSAVRQRSVSPTAPLGASMKSLSSSTVPALRSAPPPAAPAPPTQSPSLMDKFKEFAVSDSD